MDPALRHCLRKDQFIILTADSYYTIVLDAAALMLASLEIKAQHVVKHDVNGMLEFAMTKCSITMQKGYSESVTALMQNRILQRKDRFEVSVDFNEQ